jgi:hypothetical protein
MRVGYKFYECLQCDNIQCYRMDHLFIVVFVGFSCFVAKLPNYWNGTCLHPDEPDDLPYTNVSKSIF